MGQAHLGGDASTGEIAAHVLTDGNADDAAQAPALLGQAEGRIASVTANGAYDGEPLHATALARQPDLPPDVAIPPRASAVPSTGDPAQQSPRDRQIRLVAEKAKIAWQRATGYGRRAWPKRQWAGAPDRPPAPGPNP